MNTLSPIDQILRTNDIFSLPGGAEETARQARQMLDTFDRVNRIIQDPEPENPTLSQRMQETARFSREVVSSELRNRLGKGLNLDTTV